MMDQTAANLLGHPKAMNAALMVLLMEDGEASGLLSRLSPDELRILGQHMCDLGEVAPQQIAAAIADFAEQADRPGLDAHGRVERVRSMMTGAVGNVRADNLMRRILSEEQQKPTCLELARWLEPDVILPLILDELPQTIAVLLVQLDPQIAAHILAGLPDNLQTDVVHRVATLGPVNPAAIGMLEELLETRLTERYGALPLKMGGVREAADIINQSGREVERRVMPGIGKMDRKLAQALENEMFKFEHLFGLDAQMMGQLLREVDSEILIDALKGVEEPQREIFFRAMSSRAADGLRDEIEARGRLKAAVVIDAQNKVVATARRLAAEGLIVFGSGGGEDDYV